MSSIPVNGDTEITAQWVEVIDENNPIRMNHLCMVFDSKNDVLIQFSGRNFNGTVSDKTLVYDFNTNEWTDMKPQVSPPPRQYSRISYNPNDGTVLLFGGSNTGGINLDDFWQYDYLTNNWTEIIVSPRPSARAFQAMEFSPLENSLIMFNGFSKGNFLNEQFFWEFNLTSMAWTQNPVTIDMDLPQFEAIEDRTSLVYDSKRDNMLLFTFANILEYNLYTHSFTNITNPMLTRYLSDATYDRLHDKIILFGGFVVESNEWVATDSTAFFDPESLEYHVIDDGGDIGTRHTENNMAYDPIRNRTILLSGSDEVSYHNDMWLLTLDDPNMVTSSDSSSESSTTESSSQTTNTEQTVFYSELWFIVLVPLIVRYSKRSG
jgi:hypothetical protein